MAKKKTKKKRSATKQPGQDENKRLGKKALCRSSARLTTVLQHHEALKVFLVERAACRARSASDDVKLYGLILFKHLSAATPFCTNLCLSVMASFGGATVDTHTMDVNY